eukprot:TRINITY_DN21777_c0_g1_i1.p1 TRINITY_DN21777_c0_g1~~TRINITY_DN21777_c0_g1_i1.p1  ORF type:complete len:273 (+),score=59.02 TRINITY_DN21777_c0_g1_i1:25-819(+)
MVDPFQPPGMGANGVVVGAPTPSRPWGGGGNAAPSSMADRSYGVYGGGGSSAGIPLRGPDAPGSGWGGGGGGGFGGGGGGGFGGAGYIHPNAGGNGVNIGAPTPSRPWGGAGGAGYINPAAGGNGVNIGAPTPSRPWGGGENQAPSSMAGRGYGVYGPGGASAGIPLRGPGLEGPPPQGPLGGTTSSMADRPYGIIGPGGSGTGPGIPINLPGRDMPPGGGSCPGISSGVFPGGGGVAYQYTPAPGCVAPSSLADRHYGISGGR